MSASQRITRAGLLRSPLGNSVYLPIRAGQRKRLPTYTQAVALLIPRRTYATETSSQNSSSSYPPPGFNAEQAKQPVQKGKDDASKKADEATKISAQATQEIEQAIGKTGATSHPKTSAFGAQALSELAADKSDASKAAAIHGDELAVDTHKKEDKKLTLWQKVKKEVAHYWDGTKLLATEVKISSRLALKMAAGYELSRRENRQLQRTVQDLGRLVPFSVFVIVPFAELLLPVALKLFPNLLPSTYEGQKSKDKKAADLRGRRKEVSAFLRDTMMESGLPVSAANAKREEFTDFFRKVRTTGESPTPEDVIKVCKIFKDDLTLDNLSRPQLVGMCKYMNLSTFGTDQMLRYHIRHRMRQIKRDDKAIAYEKVDSLSVPELQMACSARGLKTQGVSPAHLRDDLQTWLDLRLKHGVPSTLLVLSNAYVYAQGKDSEIDTQIEALQSVLSSIPEELFHEIELEVHTAEGAATNKQRLEVLKEQQELIEEENDQNEENKESGRQLLKDDEDIDEKEDTRRAAETNTNEARAGEAETAEQDAAEVKKAEDAEGIPPKETK